MAGAARDSQGPRQAESGTLPDGHLSDRFGRRITYLRLSVTDRCNLKCEYCVPVSNSIFFPRRDLLTDGEIVRLVDAMARRGLEKVRFTGGEPLVRPRFLDLVSRVHRIDGIRKVCVTTNGLLLESMAADLIAAGVDHFNVSLDTLDPERFRLVTRGGDIARVWRGIDRLLDLGVEGVKLNAVLMRGVNDDEVDAFLEIARTRPIEVRFIELMPIAHCGEVHDSRYVSSVRVVEALERRGAVTERGCGDTDGPAVRFRMPGAVSPVGLISPVSEESFCDRCNRVRLSADGKLKLCLFGDEYVDLRAVLRGDGGDEALTAALISAMDQKPEKMAGFNGFTMMAVGG